VFPSFTNRPIFFYFFLKGKHTLKCHSLPHRINVTFICSTFKTEFVENKVFVGESEMFFKKACEEKGENHAQG